MKEKKVRAYNIPFRSSTAEYESVVERIAQEAKKNGTVKSVYLLGGKWTPGISDMDIVVVHKHGVTPLSIPGPQTISPEAARIFTHRYFTFDEEDFDSFFYIYPSITTKISLIWGEDCKPVIPDDSATRAEYKLFIATSLIDVFVSKLLLFPLYMKSDNMNVRKMLLEMYSLKYTARLVYELTGEAIGGDFIAKISSLRDTWFDRTAEDRTLELRHLAETSSAVVGDAMLRTNEYFRAQEFVAPERLSFSNKQYRIDFTGIWRARESEDRLMKTHVSVSLPGSGKKLTYANIVLPDSFAPFFLNRARHEGMLSKLMVRALRAPRATSMKSPNLGQVVDKRINVIDCMFRRTVENGGFYRVPFTYGFSVADIKKPIRVGLASVLLRILSTARRHF